MVDELEQLLNRLIQRGWKPRWIPHLRNAYYTTKYISFSKRTIFWLTFYEKSIRALVAKESWLWQFVCENGMRPKRPWYEEHIWQRDGKTNWDRCILENEYQYYLIESALCDEDKLEDFLLSNIKVWNED